MIQLSITTAVILYLSATLLALLGVWIYSYQKSKKRKLIVSDKALYCCEYCHFVYLDAIDKKITRCPQCQCYTDTKKPEKGQ